MKKAIKITAAMLVICLMLSTGSITYKILTTKTPAQVTVKKTRDDYWQECMNKYDNEPGNYMQVCFYSAIDSCKTHGCVVDPLLEEKK